MDHLPVTNSPEPEVIEASRTVDAEIVGHEPQPSLWRSNALMQVPPTGRRTVEAAVATLQERLADGDPAAFSRETIDALRELTELLHESTPNAGGTENPQ